MSETQRPRRIGRSIGAVVAGALTGIILSIGTDALLRAAGIFPALSQPMSDALFLLATTYRTIYGVGGSYIAARFAPNRPMLHALVLGAIGLAVSILGLVVTWKQGTVIRAPLVSTSARRPYDAAILAGRRTLRYAVALTR
jgi:hypothetical protein